MGDDLSYAMFLPHQGQARDLSQQHKLQQVLLTFVGSESAAKQYERSLGSTLTSTHHRFVTKVMKKMKGSRK